MDNSVNSTDNRIGNKIKKIRLMRGLHQTDLQELTGIHATWLSRIENGRGIPTEDELARIREALAWTPELDEHLEAIAR